MASMGGAEIRGLKRSSPHGRIMALSMMKDEGPYLLEWVAHHLTVGFTDILVYTNDCSDGTDLMLMRLQDLGLAHHRVNTIAEGLRPQPSALNHAQAEPLVAQADWLMVFDADEFLCLRHGNGTLDGLLDATTAQGANGVVVTWRIFGSGGVQDWSREPVTEQYRMAAPMDWNKGWGVKTLFRYSPDHWKLGIHRPKLKTKWLDTGFPDTIRWLNGSGRPMEEYFRFRGWRSITRTIGYDWAQMNHYAVKSIDAYAIRKFRGNVNFKKDKYNADYWALQDRNEVRDDTMLRYSADRRRILDLLLTDPELHRLHHAALTRAEALLAGFKGTPEYEMLVDDLRAASAVPITEVEAKPPQARDPAKIAALMSKVEERTVQKARDDRTAVPDTRPVALYIPGVVAPSDDLPVAWYSNRDIDLPADPRLFTAAALAQIADGKFERNLARNLPRLLPRGGGHLEIGAGAGFLAAHLARVRPDLSQVVIEGGAAHLALLRMVWARNGIAEGDRLRLLPGPVDLASLLAATRADTLMLGDPGIGPADLAAIVAIPAQVFLTGRLLAERGDDIAGIVAVVQGWGLTATAPLDPTVALGFVRPGVPA